MPWYRIKFSEYDSDVFSISNKYEYQTRHISYMTYPTGRLETGDLLYRRGEYIWDETIEYPNLIDITWNFGVDESNEYYNIIALETIKDDNMYMLLHNKGRLYALHQPIENRFYKNIPQDLEKSFTGINCAESSIGLFLNTTMSNIVTDTFNLYNSATNNYDIGEYEIDDYVLPELLINKEDINNLYLNGNETFNTIPVQRIFETLKSIQSNLISTSK